MSAFLTSSTCTFFNRPVVTHYHSDNHLSARRRPKPPTPITPTIRRPRHVYLDPHQQTNTTTHSSPYSSSIFMLSSSSFSLTGNHNNNHNENNPNSHQHQDNTSSSPSPSPSPSTSTKVGLWRHLTSKKTLGLAAVLLCILLLRRSPPSAAAATTVSTIISSLTNYASNLGTSKATILLFFTNFLTVLFCFPANMGLMIAAGAILPPIHAFSALFFSKLLAACVAFVLSKTLLERRAKHALNTNYPRLASLMQRESSSAGWKFVLLMRLSPFPGFMLNYLLSLTGVPFAQYLLGSVIGIAPPIANLVLIGNTAKEVGAGVVGATSNTAAISSFAGLAWLPLFFKVATMSSMVAVTVYITKFLAKAFDKDGTVAAANDSTTPANGPNGKDDYKTIEDGSMQSQHETHAANRLASLKSNSSSEDDADECVAVDIMRDYDECNDMGLNQKDTAADSTQLVQECRSQ